MAQTATLVPSQRPAWLKVLAALVLLLGALGLSTPPANAAAGTPILFANETLGPGESLISPNGAHRLVMQTDGNLVLYSNGSTVRWATMTFVTGSRLVMQGDGNLVMYGPANQVVWHLGTHGSGAERLAMQDDGNLVLYTATNAAVWHTNTRFYPATLTAPATLGGGDYLQSPSREYTLAMQGDGNLVLYAEGRGAIWYTGTNQPGSRLVAQDDGNLVIYNSSNQALWNTGTRGATGTVLSVQDDGNVVLYASGPTAVWSTGTRVETAPTGGTGSWTTPAIGTFTSGYGLRNGTMHYGVDIANSCGTPIYAASGGTVVGAGRVGGYGNLITIDHGGGIVTRYAHMSDSGVQVHVGQVVGKGQRIALIGNFGDSTGCHLHFEVKVNGSFVDPERFLSDRGVRLR